MTASTSQSVKLIAEIGCNHKGDIEIAKKMIRTAANFCEADIVKFQKRTNTELLTPDEYNRPHPVPENAYGNTYGAHREYLEFTLDQHLELIDECRQNGVEYSTSVWDLTAAKEMTSLNPPLLKIPSATNLHFKLQEYLCENYGGEIHVSTGMTTRQEIDTIVDFYKERGRAKDLVIYACTSGYPVASEDICLFEITRIMEKYGPELLGVGFSGHHLGISADVAATTIGRINEQAGHGKFTHIERHFTLDRTWKGTDHAASLEPDGLRKLKRDVSNIDQALKYKNSDILEVEAVQRDKLKWTEEKHGALSEDA